MENRFLAQRQGFAADPSPPLATRLDRLERLERLLDREGDHLLAAIDGDFNGRSPTESRIIELFPSLEGVRYARRHLAKWMKPERRRVSLWFAPARAAVHYQPKGVVGIVAPWNYPLFLAAGPLAAALAAGNRAMLKVSELCPAFSAAFAEAVARHFAPEEVTVIEGDAEVARRFVELPFDHLLFTGSTAVGRQVMAAAARNLTPVTLELGGKSPVILGEDFPIDTAAQRIVLAKLLNGGQTCVAPDYVLLPAGRREAFIAAARQAARRFYGATAQDYAGIVSDRHFARLQELRDQAQAAGARVEPLLEEGAALPGRRFPPAIITGVTPDMRIMREEIFGPLLPLVTYERLEEAIAFVNAGDRPLALYVFDHDAGRVERILAATHSGGVTVNDCMLHVVQDDLPFGGIGPSGMGSYHGPEGFKTFSHARSVFRQAALNGMPLLYPPYGARAEWLLRLMLRRKEP